MGEWLDIDTAPLDGTDILLLTHDGMNMIVASWEEDAPDDWRWMTLDGPTYHRDVATHWMPLPPPPQRATTSGES